MISTTIARKIRENNNKLLSMVREIYTSPVGAYKALEETNFNNNFIVSSDTRGYVFAANSIDPRIEKIVKSVFLSVAAFLSYRKKNKEEEAQAVVLIDPSGTFKFAGWVEYTPNKNNPDEPGNYSLTMTFEKEDLADLEKRKSVTKYQMNSTEYLASFNKVANEVGINFDFSSVAYESMIITIENLVLTLYGEIDDNNNKAEISLDGYFTAYAENSDDDIHCAIVPEGQLKAFIKDDLKIEI